MYIHMFIYVCIEIHILLHICIYRYVYIYIYVYVYIHIFTHLVIMKHFNIQVLAELIQPSPAVEAVFGRVAYATKASKQLLKIVQQP